MKLYFLGLVFCCFAFSYAQHAQPSANMSLNNAKTSYIRQASYLLPNSVWEGKPVNDSLKGFDEAALKTELLTKGISGSELYNHLAVMKERFLQAKYATPIKNEEPSFAKGLGQPSTIQSFPCYNEGFELSSAGSYSTASAVLGWTLSSRFADGQCNSTSWSPGSSSFSVLTTPVFNFPYVGNVPHSPLGGTKIVQLNNFITGDYDMNKLAQTFPVTASNNLFQFAYAGYWVASVSGHTCCEQPSLRVMFRDNLGNLLNCATVDLGQSPCSANNYSLAQGVANWTNWQVKQVDLTPFIGTAITVEVISADCAFGGHNGAALFDASCGSQIIPSWNTASVTTPSIPVSFCAGSGNAILQAPLGYATYSWMPPASHPSLSVSQSTSAVLTTSNASAGQVFTVNLATSAGCIYTASYALTPSTVQVIGLGSSPSCSLGSAGSATVLGFGSGTGYTYSWLNTTNSVVGTSSVVTGLSPGIYSVQLSANGSPSCGVTTQTIAVMAGSNPLMSFSQYFCASSPAYLQPIATGTNYQWYNNMAAISASLGGNGSSLTVGSPSNGSIYRVAYTSQGCRDTLEYTLLQTISGSLNAISSPSVCQGTNTGSVAITLTAAVGLSSASYSFSVFSSSTLQPAYTTTTSGLSSPSYTAGGLYAGASYVVTGFDGACTYSTSLTVPAFVYDYSISPPSATLCSGGYQAINIGLLQTNLSLSSFSMSWSPDPFVITGTNSPYAYSPTVAPGTQTTFVSTLSISPLLLYCPVVKSISMTVVNPATPTISPIPNLCSGGGAYTIAANPPGGYFISNPYVSSIGVILPAFTPSGLQTFSYANVVGACISTAYSTFQVFPTPTISVSGNTLICEGQSTSFLASGANTYVWDQTHNGPVYVVNPAVNTTYTVEGTDMLSNCSNTMLVSVQVTPMPILNIQADTIICAGESVVLMASGADSYQWLNGPVSNSFLVNPAVSTSYTLTGTNHPGSCTSSTDINILVNTCTGIEQHEKAQAFRIFPNPANDMLSVVTNEFAELMIVDVVGKQYAKMAIEPGLHQLDLRSYPAGTYFMVVSTRESRSTHTLIKINR